MNIKTRLEQFVRVLTEDGESNTLSYRAKTIYALRTGGTSAQEILNATGRTGPFVYDHYKIGAHLTPSLFRHLDEKRHGLSLRRALILIKFPQEKQSGLYEETKFMSESRGNLFLRQRLRLSKDKPLDILEQEKQKIVDFAIAYCDTDLEDLTKVEIAELRRKLRIIAIALKSIDGKIKSGRA